MLSLPQAVKYYEGLATELVSNSHCNHCLICFVSIILPPGGQVLRGTGQRTDVAGPRAGRLHVLAGAGAAFRLERMSFGRRDVNAFGSDARQQGAHCSLYGRVWTCGPPANHWISSHFSQIGYAEMKEAVVASGGMAVQTDTFHNPVFRESLKRVFAKPGERWRRGEFSSGPFWRFL